MVRHTTNRLVEKTTKQEIVRLTPEHRLRTVSRVNKGKRKVQEVPQSQTAALPRPKEEEENDKSKQAQTEQTYKKH